MSSSEQSIDQETIEQTKQQIRGLVSEIAQLAKTDMSPEEFYSAFLQRIVSALAAVGGAVWLLAEGRRPSLAYQINISDTLVDANTEEAKRHHRLLNYIVQRNEPHLIPPLSGASDERAGGNPTRYLLVLAPLRSEGEVEGVVEIFQRPDAQPVTQRGYLKFLLQMCELAGEWLKSRKLKQFSDKHSLWEQADHFARLCHDSLDLRETAYTVSNEGRRLIGCDRVSVAIATGNKCRIEAVSGQDTLENRSNIVHLLSQLASRVVATGEPLWYEGFTEDLPPQVEQALEHYIDESYTKSLAVLPLRKPKQFFEVTEQENARNEAEIEDNTTREIIGALIVEQIENSMPRDLLEPRVDLVYEHSARALSNAMEHNNLFLMPVWRTIGRSKWLVRGRTLPKTVAVSAAILVLIAFLFAYWVPFNLEGNGTLQPVDKRDVFVDVQGVVKKVYVKHGAMVAEGQELCVLENTDLEVQYQELVGKLLSTDEQRRSLDKTLLDSELPLSQEERIRLSGQRAQLATQVASYEAQKQLIEDRRRRLTVKSPITGQVITWDVQKTLENRPVTTGQVLMTVANVDSEWELEVFVKEGRIGHVDEFLQKSQDQQLKASFILAAAPAYRLEGVVKKTEIHEATDMHQDEGHSVLVRVDFDKSKLPIQPRPGASVTVDIECGRAPLGYTWFHEAWEWVQKNLLF